MNPVEVPGANRWLGAPEDWNAEQRTQHGECATLPVLDTGALLQSAWMPEPEELAALNRGLPVLLTIYGRSHPVVSLAVLAVPAMPRRADG